MDISEAKEKLNACERAELRDHAFGDTEVFWYKDGVLVANGYFSGTTADVWIESNHTLGDPNRVSITFHGAESHELRKCGTEGPVSRNDETGPDDYVEGEIMPGLSKGDVYHELTGEYWDGS
jgi:hypothetical protein